MEAIDFFSSTYIPNNLVCREKEYSEVFDFIKNAYNGVKNTSLLISGPPGTGKSIVVRKALDNIYENANNYHFINAMDYRSALDFLNALSMAFPSSLAKSNGSFTSKLEFLKTQFISVGPTKSGLKYH